MNEIWRKEGSKNCSTRHTCSLSLSPLLSLILLQTLILLPCNFSFFFSLLQKWEGSSAHKEGCDLALAVGHMGQ